MKKKVKNIEDNKSSLLYFINNLLCIIASLIYMFFISITSISLFPVVQQTKELTNDVMLETIVKADIFIIENFITLFVVAILVQIVNYIGFRKKNKKILWGLVVLSSLALIINIVRVLMFYI